jgi:hypothetical protein
MVFNETFFITFAQNAMLPSLEMKVPLDNKMPLLKRKLT